MKQTVLILLALLTLMSYAARSQTIINVKENNALTTKELQEVQSITFSDRNLRLNLKTGDVMSYALSDVQKIDFGITITAIVDEQTTVESTTAIYPNPSNVNEALNLIFESEVELPISLTIYGLDGTMKNRLVFAPNDVALFTFQLHNIQSGMYIAVIQQGDLVKTEKLIIK